MTRKLTAPQLRALRDGAAHPQGRISPSAFQERTIECLVGRGLADWQARIGFPTVGIITDAGRAHLADLDGTPAPAPIELTALTYERRTGGDGTAEFDSTTVYAVWVRTEIESAQQRGIKVADNGYGMIKIHSDKPVRFFALPDTPAAAPQEATQDAQDAQDAPQAPTAADGHREAATAHERAREDSWERSGMDGALSQYAHGLSAQRERLAARIADLGGRHALPALFDLDGNLVAAKLIDGRFGESWGLMRHDTDRGRFAAWFRPSQARTVARRRAADARKGFYVGTALVPATAELGGGGVGCIMAYAKRTDSGFTRDAVIIDNGHTAVTELQRIIEDDATTYEERREAYDARDRAITAAAHSTTPQPQDAPQAPATTPEAPSMTETPALALAAAQGAAQGPRGRAYVIPEPTAEELAQWRGIDAMVDRDMPPSRYSDEERSALRAHLTWHGDDCGC